jgi:hypothetical protein
MFVKFSTYSSVGIFLRAYWLKRIGGCDLSFLKTVFHPCGSINSPGYFFVVTKVSLSSSL